MAIGRWARARTRDRRRPRPSPAPRRSAAAVTREAPREVRADSAEAIAYERALRELVWHPGLVAGRPFRLRDQWAGSVPCGAGIDHANGMCQGLCGRFAGADDHGRR